MTTGSRLLFHSEKVGCGSTIRLADGSVCMISVAQRGVRVRATKGIFAPMRVSFGAIIFDETDIMTAAKTAMALTAEYPNWALPVEIKNLVLKAFSNAVWHCETAGQAGVRLMHAAEASR